LCSAIGYNAIVQEVKPPKNLFEFFQNSRLVGARPHLERLPGDFREIEI
jgi:hypothetical protein